MPDLIYLSKEGIRFLELSQVQNNLFNAKSGYADIKA